MLTDPEPSRRRFWHRFKFNPLRDHAFWFSVATAAAAFALVLLSVSVYRISYAGVSTSDKNGRIIEQLRTQGNVANRAAESARASQAAEIEQLQAQIASSAAATDADSAKQAAKITDLQAQLAAASAATQADLVNQAAKVECTTRFTYAIEAASSAMLVAIGQLVSVISTTVPGPDRESAIGDGNSNVIDKVTEYQSAVQQRIDYDLAGSPLPCPLNPGLTG